MSIDKTVAGFGLKINGDASVAPGSACTLMPVHATIVQAGGYPVGSRADITRAVTGVELGTSVRFGYRGRLRVRSETGLGSAQTAEVAWLKHKGYPFLRVDVAQGTPGVNDWVHLTEFGTLCEVRNPELAQTMQAMGMPQHLPLLARNNITVEMLPGIDAAALRQLGISSSFDQARFLTAALRQAPAAAGAGLPEGLPPNLALEVGREQIDFGVAPLGSGSFADVFAGTYRFCGQAAPSSMAFKVFRGGQAVTPDARRLIERELRLGSQLRHENLIRLFGLIDVPHRGLALVLELAPCGSLRSVLDNRAEHPDLPWQMRVNWLVGVTLGMAELHGMLPHSIIHRDLKAANVLLSGEDLSTAVAKVSDFGVSLALEASRISLSGGGGAGTLAWKAPEVFAGRYSEKSDVFGFAVVCFEVITRQNPWEGLSQAEVMARAANAFNPQDPRVQRNLARGISIEEQHEEWLEDYPLGRRRPDLSLAQADCPEALSALVPHMWADDAAVRPTFRDCTGVLKAAAPRLFETSNFKRHYEYAAIVPITHAAHVLTKLNEFVFRFYHVKGLTTPLHNAAVRDFLTTLEHRVAPLVVAAGGPLANALLSEAGATAELLWTADNKMEGMGSHAKELCSLINAAIREDHPELAAATAGIVRAINSLCLEGRVAAAAGSIAGRFPADGITFRGGDFDDAHQNFFTVGKCYRVPGFLATSFSQAKAHEFIFTNAEAMGKQGILWVVHVDPAGAHNASRRCKHVNFVRNSLVPGEEEYLFTAYSVFTVRAVVWGADGTVHRVELDASLDNALEREHLPLAPWY